MSMSSNLDSQRMEPEPAQAALASLWRRKVVVLAIVAAALVLGIVASVVMPPRYTAEAYIRGELAAPDAPSKEDETLRAGSISLDLLRLIETQSQLLQSHQVARRVVEELGLERLQPVVSESQWLSIVFHTSAEKTSVDEMDIAATRLLRRLSVKSDQRSYLVTVRYTASDSELAKLVANAFVAELVRSTKLQTLSQRSFAAQAILSNKLAKFGDKHPGVALARMRVAATDGLMKEQLSETPDAILQAAAEHVTEAISAPSSPNPPFVISLFLLVGLVVAVGVALWLERDRWGVVFSRHYARPFA